MIHKKKYEKSQITQFSKSRMIVRKGGYFPGRLYLMAVALAIFIASSLTLLVLETNIWLVLLFPMIALGIGFKIFYKRHIRFGEKISINQDRLLIEFYGSNSTRKGVFRKGSIKSMTCTVSGIFYHFKVYKTDNSSMSFSIYDAKKQNPLKAILKFADLEKVFETKVDDKKVMRFWSKSPKLKRKQREIKEISETLYEYRSEYFSISEKDNDLSIQITGSTSDKIYIDNNLRVIKYQTKNRGQASIHFDAIKSIKKRIVETSPTSPSNQIKIKVVINLRSGESINIIEYDTHEATPADMEIIEIEKDFNNLVAIIDMNIKASIDEELDKLDLDELNAHHDQLLDVPMNKKETESDL